MNVVGTLFKSIQYHNPKLEQAFQPVQQRQPPKIGQYRNNPNQQYIQVTPAQRPASLQLNVMGDRGEKGERGPPGPTGPPGPGGSTTTTLGGIATSDLELGNDSNASVGGKPFKTLECALSVATSGDEIWLLPGTHYISKPIYIKNIGIYGFSKQTCIIEFISNTAIPVAMITIGENCSIDNVTIILSSSNTLASPLIGLLFKDRATETSLITNSIIKIDNSTVSHFSFTEVFGVVFNSETNFQMKPPCISHSHIIIHSNGSGNKRGILVNSNCYSVIKDVLVTVSNPPSPGSSGSYVGIENSNEGTIVLRSCVIGSCPVSTNSKFTASDILQSNHAITNPIYLQSKGIHLGPGCELITKTAGQKGFCCANPSITLIYGVKGKLSTSSTGGWLSLGTQQATLGQYPDPSNVAFYAIQQPCILYGLSASLNTAPGKGMKVTVTIYKSASFFNQTQGCNGPQTTIFSVTFGGTEVNTSFTGGSVSFSTGDRLHVYVDYKGYINASDLYCQLNLF
jgi:hypothetical protein